MKRKIAVLGGGAAALTAVAKLVESDPDAYDITVYQLGWRLGGKGASGRRMDSAGDHRIEEHGLHFMFGFYRNVFDVTRAAYEQVYPEDPNAWHRFFRDEKTAITMINFPDPAGKAWEAWPLPNPQGYGNRPDKDVHGKVALVVRSMFRWLKQLAEAAAAAHVDDPDLRRAFSAGAPTGATDTALDAARRKIDAMDAPAWFDPATPTSVSPYWELGLDFVRFLEGMRAPVAEDVERVKRLLDYSFDTIRGLFRTANGPQAEAARARYRTMKKLLSIVLTIARGLTIDLLLQPDKNWFDLDDRDFKEWVAHHGGDPESPPVRALYDAVFATYKPLAAGSILQAFSHAAFLFEGGFLYKMQSGMGDTIFTPLYLALKQKGVKFEFFHRVLDVAPSADGTQVDTLDFERQVDLAGGSYDPLVLLDVDIGGPMKLQCWPSEPLWERLPAAETARLRGKVNLESGWVPQAGATRTLKRGVDFDDVILGISVAGLPEVCPKLLVGDARFARHVEALVPNTTATQGLQLWTAAPHAPKQPSPVIVPYTEPYDTVAEMSHLIGAEAWVGERPSTLYYLCSAIDEPGLTSVPPRTDPTYPGALNARGWAEAKNWCVTDAPGLWTNLSPGGTFDWNALHAPVGTVGEARFAAQYVSTTINASDRYVIPGPNSYRKRLKSNETRYKNLYLTGDWIRTSLSIGCLEAAVMSGIQAARALAMERGNHEVPRAANDWIDDVTVRS